MTAEVMLAQRVRVASRRLGGAGTVSPKPEAERLAAHALGCTWSQLWTRLREPVTRDVSERFDALVARRAHGEPLAYVLGSAGFYGLELAVGPGVLVPRPETEVVVDVVLELMPDDAPVVVDVGTGSGAIALSIAAMRPDAFVVGTDTSDVALGYARRNGHGVRWVRGDLLRPLAARGAVDLIVSNPPYVAIGERVSADVAAEPPDALYAGPTGDEVLLRLVRDAPSVLASGGSLVLEVGTPEQANSVAAALDCWARWGVREDLTGRPRVVWATRA